LRDFCDLQERGEISRDNPFLVRRRQKIASADRLEMSVCLAAFEGDLLAGRIRRGKRKAVSASHASLALTRVRKIMEGCRIRRAT
jgi:hypothetical protein